MPTATPKNQLEAEHAVFNIDTSFGISYADVKANIKNAMSASLTYSTQIKPINRQTGALVLFDDAEATGDIDSAVTSAASAAGVGSGVRAHLLPGAVPLGGASIDMQSPENALGLWRTVGGTNSFRVQAGQINLIVDPSTLKIKLDNNAGFTGTLGTTYSARWIYNQSSSQMFASVAASPSFTTDLDSFSKSVSYNPFSAVAIERFGGRGNGSGVPQTDGGGNLNPRNLIMIGTFFPDAAPGLEQAWLNETLSVFLLTMDFTIIDSATDFVQVEQVQYTFSR